MIWQPIETAPKDGTVFLAYWKGHIRECSVLPRDDGLVWDFGTWKFHERFSPQYIPTHWMPLPEAPK
jgi:hypothetical protein